jgi:PAS domain S-box-containing protein
MGSLAGGGQQTTSMVPDTPWAVRATADLGLDFLAALVRSTADGLIVLDSDYRIAYANPAACEELGYPFDQVLAQDSVALMPEDERQTYRAFLDKARGGNAEASTVILHRPDGSELEVALRPAVLDLKGKQFFMVVAIRDVTERQRQARRAVALAQAAASVAASDSIEAILEAISEYAVVGTRALAAWVTLNDEDDVAAWVGAAGVRNGFRERLRSAASVAAASSAFGQAVSAQRVVVYADARQRGKREGWTASLTGALKSLRWQSAAFAPLLYGGQ